MTTSCSATSIASSWSWVTKIVVTWTSSWRRRSQVAQVLADLRVEGAERLVEQQHVRLDRERPGQRHPLALAPGELRRIALGEPVELDQAQQLVHAGVDLGLRPLADLQTEADVARSTVMCLKAA